MSKTKEALDEHQPNTPKKTTPHCGIIMPISDTPDLGYPIGHWGQVLDIVTKAAEAVGFTADMVSNDSQVEVIHATIIKNIYANDVAVCDVSTRNPNVMFELGLRIASKKPVILIKDEVTTFSFDTQLIPHLPYRRDLRMHETLSFQRQLSKKIKQLHEESQQPEYKSFLEQFTSYTLAQVNEQQIGVPEYLTRISTTMQGLEDSVKFLAARINGSPAPPSLPSNLPKLPSLNSLPFNRDIYKTPNALIDAYMKHIGKPNISSLTESQLIKLVAELGSSALPEVSGKPTKQIRQVIDEWEDLPF